jgi:hypothetical protein|nr:MAG TPA: hypothetical protein [Caudoviricetes sp.]
MKMLVTMGKNNKHLYANNFMNAYEKFRRTYINQNCDDVSIAHWDKMYPIEKVDLEKKNFYINFYECGDKENIRCVDPYSICTILRNTYWDTHYGITIGAGEVMYVIFSGYDPIERFEFCQLWKYEVVETSYDGASFKHVEMSFIKRYHTSLDYNYYVEE